MVATAQPLLHWNYFFALASDLENLSRYIEFHEKNFNTYSIELAHLLLASASEVDVIAKGICKQCDPGKKAENIVDYRDIITVNIPTFSNEEVFIPRYGLSFSPWSSWSNSQTPSWWQSYNDVKHKRSDYFEEANLKNVLNSIGGLLIGVFYFYRFVLSPNPQSILRNKDVTLKLNPESDFIKLQGDYYHNNVVF